MSEIINRSPNAIAVFANGQTYTVKMSSTIADLLQEFSIAPTRVVVQMDGMIVQRTEFSKTVLREGSKLEIVTLVGGG